MTRVESSRSDDGHKSAALFARLWWFLNSSFGLWLLSTVAVGVAVWQYEIWTERTEHKSKLRQQAAMMDLEIEGRLSQYAIWFEGLYPRPVRKDAPASASASRSEPVQIPIKTGTDQPAEFYQCVTGTLLFESIRVLAAAPRSLARQQLAPVVESRGEPEQPCGHRFELMSIHAELAELSLVAIYSKRMSIEDQMFPAVKRIDPEDGAIVEDRDEMAALAVAEWHGAMETLLDPYQLWGAERDEPGRPNLAEFAKYFDDTFNESPRKPDILPGADCLLC